MRKYYFLFISNLKYVLINRTRVLVWFINDSVSFIVFPFLWLIIYQNRIVIGGYTVRDIITYYIIIATVNILTTAHSADDIKESILKGRLSTTLLKPIHLLWQHVIFEITHKMMNLLFLIVIGSIAIVTFYNYLAFPQSPITIALFLCSLIISFALSNCIMSLIGIVAFWIGETTTLRQFREVIEKLFSGELAPLTFFPLFLQTIAAYLPFKYLAYFPSQIYLEKISYSEILKSFLGAFCWIAALIIIIIIVWKRGLKRYDGSSI